jgi:hypothetical protein
LIQGFAAALSHHPLQQAPDYHYPVRQTFEFRNLSLGEFPPTFRSPSDLAKAEEQLSDFVQCKTELSRSLNDRQPIKSCCVVASLLADALRGWKQPNLFVIANGRRPKSDPACYFGDV